jgi:Kinesin motor domain
MPKIRVGIRIKPDDASMRLEGFVGQQDDGSGRGSRVQIVMSDNKHDFQYDDVFNEDCDQKDIFATVGLPVVNEVLEGFNGTIFAFGQTVK